MKNIIDLLEGMTVKVMTDAKVEVKLVIESVEEKRHSRQITPDTRENDWWGETQNWTTYNVKFTNGFVKSYDSLLDINVE